jgi:Domain of Unknown Function (DUF1080)
MSYRVSLLIVPLACLVGCTPESGTEPEAAASASQPGSAPVAQGEWVVLFDGTSLDGWNPVGDANWTIADGAVRANSGNGFLVSASNYDDFDLSLEFFASPDANSGVFMRCMNPQEISDTSCYEANIYDRRPDPEYRTGGIVNVASPTKELYAGGRWNNYEITLNGPRLQVTLNDVQIVDVEDGKLGSGPIALQYGAGTVMFRNVRVRPR